ncbi:MAG: rhombosortase [Desulfobulbaceae bacterium]|nr:rhombosortase [Desulfobulbaceae bacterium]
MNKNEIKSRWQKLPVLSLSLGLISCLLFFSSTLRQALEYDRAAVAGGEVWRIVTGHFIHWNLGHLLWNVAVFCLLGILSEFYDEKGYFLCLSVSTLMIPLVLWWLQPDLASYRGLSGLASGLFLLMALRVLIDNFCNRQWLPAAAALACTAAFFGKVIFETISGATVFAETDGLYQPVPLVHFVGGLIGISVALLGIHGDGRRNQVTILLPAL